MKWLLILFSIFKTLFSSGGSHPIINPVAELKEVVKKNAVKLMLALIAVSALATIFAAGLVMIAVDIAAQYDQNSVVYFSTMIMMGIILMLIPVIIGAVLFAKFNKDEEEEIKTPVLQNVGVLHPIQDALALLIQDFVKEREMKRAQQEVNLERRYPTQSPTDPRVPSSDDFMH